MRRRIIPGVAQRAALGVTFGLTLAGSLALMATCPGAAHAYRRTTVDDIPGGTPLFWARRSVAFRDVFTEIPGVPADEARLALGRSVQTWSEAECTGMSLRHLGPARQDRTNLTGGAPDMENRIVFRATAWPAEVGAETLALTTTVYRRSTGEILDADIDVNAVNHAWSAGPDPAGFDDVENTLTHELGHALGFAHTEVPDATMFANADLGETLKRDLAPDDLEAICTVYPPAQHLMGVSCAAQSRTPTPGWALTLATLLLTIWRRRISKNGSPCPSRALPLRPKGLCLPK
jgi:hypothetical protein